MKTIDIPETSEEVGNVFEKLIQNKLPSWLRDFNVNFGEEEINVQVTVRKKDKPLKDPIDLVRRIDE
jgi:hypothetical protein